MAVLVPLNVSTAWAEPIDAQVEPGDEACLGKAEVTSESKNDEREYEYHTKTCAARIDGTEVCTDTYEMHERYRHKEDPDDPDSDWSDWKKETREDSGYCPSGLMADLLTDVALPSSLPGLLP